jgi:hypothetical protein
VRAAQARALPRHPVVLVHGFMGGGTPPERDGRRPYFGEIEPHLRSLGVVVSVPALGPTASVCERALRLKRHIDATHPAGRVNLVAHSIGGLACRDLVSRLGMHHRVASVVTIATPHRGTAVADWIVRTLGLGLGVETLLARLGVTAEVFRDLTTWRCREFNARTPDRPGVRYFSLGGAQPWHRLRGPLMPLALVLRAHGQPDRARSLAALAAFTDEPWAPAAAWFLSRPADAAVLAVATWPGDDGNGALSPERGAALANDGVVPLPSTVWGESHEVIDMDHLDQIAWRTSSIEAPLLYEGIVGSLAAAGL